ncbi:MAG: Ig-like domain-containing protein [Myxococcales bacterium]
MRRDHLVVLLAAGSIACGSSSPPPTVNTVVITATALELPVGGTLQLVANAFDASGILIPGTKAAWTSSDPRIATISDVGVLSGVAFGDTNVTATVNGVTGTQPFTVSGIQSGAGSATVDGSMAAGEWSRASVLDIAAVNLPGGTTPGKLYVMNDGTDLYLALTFSRTPPAGETSDLSFEFDNDASGTLNAGDDGFMLSDLFHDLVTVAPCPTGGPACEVFDTDLMNGTDDGAGAFVNDGATSVYELRHPLRSGDSHDFLLVPGARIGMNVSLHLTQTGGASQDTNVPGLNAFLPVVIR